MAQDIYENLSKKLRQPRRYETYWTEAEPYPTHIRNRASLCELTGHFAIGYDAYRIAYSQTLGCRGHLPCHIFPCASALKPDALYMSVV